MKMNRSPLPTSLWVWASLVGILPIACVTQDVDPVANGTAGGGGTGGAGGATANGGSSAGGSSAGGAAGMSTANNGGGGSGGIASDPGFGVVVPCLPIVRPLITDFTYGVVAPVVDAGSDGGAAGAGPVAMAPDPSLVNFGDFTTGFSGGIYVYPATVGDPFAIASDISTNEWHLSGSIGNYSGLGLYYAPAGCNQVDASAYDGISFTIRGTVAMGNALTLQVNHSANEISHLWLNSQATPPVPLAAPNSGRCLPPTANQYDGSCSAGTYQVPVTATETTITVLWADLIGGRPAAAVNPAEITDIRWVFPVPPNVGLPNVVPFDVDFYIDDLSFIGGP